MSKRATPSTEITRAVGMHEILGDSVLVVVQ